MGFITGLVVYLATFIRALTFSVDAPPEGPLILILVFFGIFLVIGAVDYKAIQLVSHCLSGHSIGPGYSHFPDPTPL